MWLAKSKRTDLAKTRKIECTVLFPTRENARTFEDRCREGGAESGHAAYAGDEELPWPVTVTAQIPTALEATDRFCERLTDIAALLGGRLLPPQ